MSEPTHDFTLTASDLDQIRRHGLDADEVRRQLSLLERGARPVRLDRPCRVGDGVVRLEPARHRELEARYNAARRDGRFAKMVPASGAATRMFRELLGALDPSGDGSANEAAVRFLDDLPRLPFVATVEDTAARHGLDVAALRARRSADAARPLLEVLLLDGPADGSLSNAPYLGYAQRPKALIPFHRGAGEERTPLAEHLDEAAEHLLDHERRAVVHFTIPQHSELDFRDAARAVEARLERVHGARFEISFSIQRPETDTVAGSADGGPLRDADGRLLFRPGGHGSLLPNLEAMAGDLVFVRNIDNVLPIHRRDEVLAWNRRLGGLLVEIEEFIHDTSHAIEAGRLDGDAVDRALRRSAELLQAPHALAALELPESERPGRLAMILDRPLRVAGVVPVAGEPGGGPFWAASPAHAGASAGTVPVTPQIVESAQIDRDDPAQNAVVAAATHFNPVHMVCRLRDHHGRPYPLQDFVDPETFFVTRKSHHGQPLLALEHPGLWNGAMAGWNTVFVEIPGTIFAPVKTVFDLLRPSHQPAP
ncbi:MAG: DUF4301 family protein [Acidobacteriota bacterium]